MAVRNDFTAGEVLAAADLNDTFNSRVPFAYGTATPTTTTEGFIWFDEATDPPTAKVWNGSAFVTFSGAGNADFSDAATGTYTDGDGVAWKYKTYTGSGTVTITKAGLCDVLVVGGGGGGGGNASVVRNGGGGGGGGALLGVVFLEPATYTVTVGAGGARGSNSPTAGFTGSRSQLGSLMTPSGGGGGGRDSGGGTDGSCGGGGGGAQSGGTLGGIGAPPIGFNGANTPASVSPGSGGGGATAAGNPAAGGTAGQGGAGLTSALTGSSLTHSKGGKGESGAAGGTNTGDGGDGSNTGTNFGFAGGSGVVIIRVRTN
jgi:hypothetical protein